MTIGIYPPIFHGLALVPIAENILTSAVAINVSIGHNVRRYCYLHAVPDVTVGRSFRDVAKLIPPISQPLIGIRSANAPLSVRRRRCDA
jgi:hypothetical protein